MTELERTLRRLGDAVEYPPTPQLSSLVAQRLEEGGGRRPGGLPWRPLTARAAVLAVAIALLVAGGVLAAVPATRDALLDLVGLGGISVERVETLPPNVRARPGLGLGEPSTLASARRSLTFRPLLPASLGEPDGVYLVRDPPPGGELSLTYAPRPGLPRSHYTGVGLLIDEIHGGFGPGFFGKLVPRGVRIERLRVDGHGAIWVQGLHEFFYKDANHTYRIGRARLAASTLLVQLGTVMVRIEGDIDLDEAIAIARSLR